jgi:hypothetical protein
MKTSFLAFDFLLPLKTIPLREDFEETLLFLMKIAFIWWTQLFHLLLKERVLAGILSML